MLLFSQIIKIKEEAKMGLFGKKYPLAQYEVGADDKVDKFTYNGKYYDLNAYVKQCEADLRFKTNSDKVKIGKNMKKAEKDYLSDKGSVVKYIDYEIAKQLADGQETMHVSVADIKRMVKDY